MGKFLRATLTALVFVGGTLSLSGKDASAHTLHWLTPDQEQALVNALPPPPAPGSAAEKDDVAALVKAQNERTSRQTEQVLTEKHADLKLFQAVLGPHFSDDREPKIYHLMKDAVKDAAIVDDEAKVKWNRPRPFVAYPNIIHPVYAAGAPSYPSGHTTFAYTAAILLSEIFPDKKAALLDEAAEIARNRVIGGVHYPSDIVEGEKLGRAVAQALLTDPPFQQELAAAKSEAAALTEN